MEKYFHFLFGRLIFILNAGMSAPFTWLTIPTPTVHVCYPHICVTCTVLVSFRVSHRPRACDFSDVSEVSNSICGSAEYHSVGCSSLRKEGNTSMSRWRPYLLRKRPNKPNTSRQQLNIHKPWYRWTCDVTRIFCFQFPSAELWAMESLL